MLTECKLAMQITAAEYEPELCSLMDAGARDLQLAGVVLPGTVSFAATNQGMQDNSTLTDALVMRAIFTYVRMHFESPADYERLARTSSNAGNPTYQTYASAEVLALPASEGGTAIVGSYAPNAWTTCSNSIATAGKAGTNPTASRRSPDG